MEQVGEDVDHQKHPDDVDDGAQAKQNQVLGWKIDHVAWKSLDIIRSKTCIGSCRLHLRETFFKFPFLALTPSFASWIALLGSLLLFFLQGDAKSH